MHWTMSVGYLLHLLFYAHIIIINNFIDCAIQSSESDNIKGDYNYFESKYFGENETYNNDKRLIIEEYYRQSALSVKNIKDISFHINMSAITENSAAQTTQQISSASENSNVNEGNEIKSFIVWLFMYSFLAGIFRKTS